MREQSPFPQLAEIDRLKEELAQWVRGAQELDRKQQRLQAVVDAIKSMPKQYMTNCHITGRVDDGCPIRPYGNVFSVQMDRYRILPMEDFERLQSVVGAARAECNRILDIMGANAYDNGLRNAARSILRALDGEP